MPPKSALRHIGAALLAAQTLVAPSFAQISPQELWDTWQNAAKAAGQTLIAANETFAGDTLRLGGVTLAGVSGGATVLANLDEILMQDQGDGSVLVTMSDEFPIEMTLPPNDPTGNEVQINLILSSPDLRLVATGDPASLRHALSAAQISLKLDRISGAPDLTLDTTLSGVVGDYLTSAEGSSAFDGTTTIQGLAMAAIGADPAQGGELRLTLAMQGIELQSSGGLLALMAAGLPPDLVTTFAGQSATTSQSAQFEAELTDGAARTTFAGTAGPASINRSIKGGVMTYSAAQQNLRVSINTPEFPFGDLAFDLAEFGVNLTAPVAQDIGLQPFAAQLKLDALALPAQVWALLDPMGALPHQPATLNIALNGEADTAAQQDVTNQLQNLTLSEFRLQLAGAEVMATGFGQFAPSTDGLPNPTAQIDVTLLGVNALMGKLVQGNIAAPEILTFPRMVLAMLATPAADGSDSYRSQIEIRDRAIFANGQILHQME